MIYEDAKRQHENQLKIAEHVMAERQKDPGAVPRTLGFPVQDINIDNMAQALPELAKRPAIAAQVSEKYGVPFTMLSNDEAHRNIDQLKAMTPDIKAETLGKLSATIPDRRAFFSLMNQIAPGSPVTRMAAGMMAYPSQRQTAQTLLAGESILNLDKEDKKQDTNSSKYALPSDAAFEASILEEIGGAYVGPSQSASARFQGNFQAIRAYYTAKAFETKKLNADSTFINEDLLKESVKAVTGGVVEWGGWGSKQKVFVPWGMKQDDFEDQIPIRIKDSLKKGGLSNLKWNNFNMVELDNGVYQLALGGRSLPGIIIDFNKPMPIKQ